MLWIRGLSSAQISAAASGGKKRRTFFASWQIIAWLEGHSEQPPKPKSDMPA
jgi:hypothetical protein